MIITFSVMYFTQSRHHPVSVAHELFLFLKELRLGQNHLRVTAESDAADSCSDTRPILCSLRNPSVCVSVCLFTCLCASSSHVATFICPNSNKYIPHNWRVFSYFKAQWSLYVPHSSYYMYHQFNIPQFYVLPTQCGYGNKPRLFPYTTLTDWFV